MQDLATILQHVQAVISDDHFVYTSGKHGSVYVNKDKIYPHTALVSRVGQLFAEKFAVLNPQVVVGPAIGGIILAQWTAFHLSEMLGHEVLGVYTEKDEQKNQVFTRGYDQLVKGQDVVLVEDLTTTGGSLQKVVASVKAAGGSILGTCAMVNRNPQGVTSQILGFPFDQLMILPVDAYDADSCPLCAHQIPINTTVGHGAKYLKSAKSA